MKREHEFDDALTLVRYLFDRAETAIEEINTYSFGLAVSLAQDSVETMLFVIARKLNAENVSNAGFDKLWKEINDVSEEPLHNVCGNGEPQVRVELVSSITVSYRMRPQLKNSLDTRMSF